MVSAIKSEAPKSRSQKKREALKLQELGCRLADLTTQQLTDAGLPTELVGALENLKGMTRHGALKRQQQRIGTLMRDLDASQLLKARACLNDPQQPVRTRRQLARSVAEKICQEGPDLLEGLMADLSPTQCKRLYQLARRARKGLDADTLKSSQAFKDLVGYLVTQCLNVDLMKHLLGQQNTP